MGGYWSIRKGGVPIKPEHWSRKHSPEYVYGYSFYDISLYLNIGRTQGELYH